MSDARDGGKILVAPNENYIPTGLPGGFFIYNAQGDEEIYFAEQNVIELFGCHTIAEFREYTGNSFRGMVHPDDLDKIQNDIQAQTFTSEKQHDYVRYRILTKQGETRYVEDFGHLLHGADGQKYFYVYIVDVDKDAYYNRNRNSLAESQVLSEMQNVDRLTGLMSRSSFNEAVQDILDDDGVRNAKQLSFIHFDIVNFKMFNENYGFQHGDDLLCRMAHTLREEFPDAQVARFSNDHFGVCCAMPDVGERVKRVHDVMEDIMTGMRAEVKAGIYELEESCSEVGQACNHARLACNTVKRRYDKIYGVYDASLYESLRLQQYVVDAVDEAVAQHYLTVFYQPIVRVKTGEICGYEALARWIDPKMGFLPPSKFIGTLEEFRLIDRVDAFVVKRVCEDLESLMKAGEPVVPVSVNLSRLDFELYDVFGLIESCRIEHGIPRDLIDIEITESALNDGELNLNAEVQRFRDAGYHIWIDDFGSGYSSLNSLMDYSFDVLKLDLEFLRTYDEHPRAGELLRHIIQAAQGLGVKSLQEGVENPQHLEFLRGIGCDLVQGYYFAHPMSLEDSRRVTREKGIAWEKGVH